jgi:HPt (histidine-containing phosphotransfer) domain-containing protein
MADAPLIDSQAIENLRSLNPGDNDEFLREIIAIYLEDTPLRITELEQRLAAGDNPKFTRAAHSIKGSSANLGAITVRAVAEELERYSQTQGLTGVADFVVRLKSEFARTQVAYLNLAQPH